MPDRNERSEEGRMARVRAKVDSGEGKRIEALEAEIERLKAELGMLRDTEEVSKLQRIYGYYLDKRLWDQIIDLFSDDCSIEIAGAGVYLGKKGARTRFIDMLGRGKTGLKPGQLYNHLQLQGVVNIDQDGKTAKGRWRALEMIGQWGEEQYWGEGTYENEYVKEDGKWKFKKMVFYSGLYAFYEDGWTKSKRPMTGINKQFPPDLPPSTDYRQYPDLFIPPFHYKNPVSGK
jgi:hypothetical protein